MYETGIRQEPEMKKKSVIAVETDINVGQTIFDVCHKSGLDVRVFHDALDALMEAARSKPGIMIFDADTPVLGSLDFADVVSRDPQFGTVGLIAIIRETDAVARRQYSSRGISVASKQSDAGKTLRRELSRLLNAIVVRAGRKGRKAGHEVSTKGAA
jgi:CheY-like chemotaxis protein